MRPRGPWLAAAALAALAGGLFLLRPRPVPPAAPAAPVDPVQPARFEIVSGVLDGPRVSRRAVLAFDDGLDAVLHEESVFRAERVGAELVFRLDAGRLFVDGGVDVRVITPHGHATARASAFDVAITERGTSVTVLQGAAVVVGNPFRKEITRGEALDLSAAGGVGEPISLDPTAAVEWARGALDAANLVRDGGFEEELARWDAPQYPETAVRADRRAHYGRRSAYVVFNAIADYRHASPRSMPFSVPAGARLRFRGYVEVTNLEAGPEGGGYLEIRDENDVPLPGGRSPLYAGAAGWRKFSIDLDVPSGLRDARVVCAKADNGAPILGTLRLDDVAVFPLPGKP
ncbi:MAG TPA: FecR domain-containing protein [Planctomycetota bacterium]